MSAAKLALVPDSAAPSTRVCRRCGLEKSAADFPGYHRQCKGCRHQGNREYIAREPEKWSRYARDWRIANAVKLLLRNAAKRAIEKSVPFTLTPEDIFIPKHCPVLGIELAPCSGRMHPNNPTIDRLIPDLGYVRGNVAVISWRANNLKRDASLEELEHIVAWIRATQRGEK